MIFKKLKTFLSCLIVLKHIFIFNLSAATVMVEQPMLPSIARAPYDLFMEDVKTRGSSSAVKVVSASVYKGENDAYQLNFDNSLFRDFCILNLMDGANMVGHVVSANGRVTFTGLEGYAFDVGNELDVTALDISVRGKLNFIKSVKVKEYVSIVSQYLTINDLLCNGKMQIDVLEEITLMHTGTLHSDKDLIMNFGKLVSRGVITGASITAKGKLFEGYKTSDVSSTALTQIEVDSFSNSGKVSSSQTQSIRTTRSFINRGTLDADRFDLVNQQTCINKEEGTIKAIRLLTAKFKNFINDGTIDAKGDFYASGDIFRNSTSKASTLVGNLLQMTVQEYDEFGFSQWGQLGIINAQKIIVAGGRIRANRGVVKARADITMDRDSYVDAASYLGLNSEGTLAYYAKTQLSDAAKLPYSKVDGVQDLTTLVALMPNEIAMKAKSAFWHRGTAVSDKSVVYTSDGKFEYTGETRAGFLDTHFIKILALSAEIEGKLQASGDLIIAVKEELLIHSLINQSLIEAHNIRLQAEKMQIDSTLKATEALTIAAKKDIELAGKAEAKSAIIKSDEGGVTLKGALATSEALAISAKKDIELVKKSSIESKTAIIKSDEGSAALRGDFKASEHMTIDGKKSITMAGNTKVGGDLKATTDGHLSHSGSSYARNMLFRARTMVNTGYIEAKENAHIKSDYIFLNLLGGINAKRVSVDTAIMLNLLGGIHGSSSVTINALLDFNLGAIASMRYTSNSLIGLNIGLVMPSFCPEDFFTWDNLFAGVKSGGLAIAPSWLRTGVNFFDRIVGGISKACQLKKKISSLDGNARLADYISLVMDIKSAAVSAYSLGLDAVKTGENIKGAWDKANIENESIAIESGAAKEVELETDVWKPYVDAAAQAGEAILNTGIGMIGSVTTDGLIGIDSGATVSANIQRRGGYSATAGGNLAYNVTDDSLYSRTDGVVYALGAARYNNVNTSFGEGAHVTASTVDVRASDAAMQRGHIQANTVSVVGKAIETTVTSSTSGQDISLKGIDVTHAGEVRAVEKATLKAEGTAAIASGSVFEGGKGTSVDARNVQSDGRISSSHGAVLVRAIEIANIGTHGIVEGAAGALVHGVDAGNAGTVKSSGGAAEVSATNTVNNTGTVDGTAGASVRGRDANNAGTVSSNAGMASVMAVDEERKASGIASNTGTVYGVAGALVHGVDASNAGTVKSSGGAAQVAADDLAHNAGTVDGTAGASVSGRDASNTGTVKSNGGAAQVTADDLVHNAGTVDGTAGASVSGRDASNTGTVKSSGGAAEVSATNLAQNAGTVDGFAGASVGGYNAINAGTIKSSEGGAELIAEKLAHNSSTGKMDGKTAAVLGTIAIQEGTAHSDVLTHVYGLESTLVGAHSETTGGKKVLIGKAQSTISEVIEAPQDTKEQASQSSEANIGSEGSDAAPVQEGNDESKSKLPNAAERVLAEAAAGHSIETTLAEGANVKGKIVEIGGDTTTVAANIEAQRMSIYAKDGTVAKPDAIRATEGDFHLGDGLTSAGAAIELANGLSGVHKAHVDASQHDFHNTEAVRLTGAGKERSFDFNSVNVDADITSEGAVKMDGRADATVRADITASTGVGITSSNGAVGIYGAKVSTASGLAHVAGAGVRIESLIGTKPVESTNGRRGGRGQQPRLRPILEHAALTSGSGDVLIQSGGDFTNVGAEIRAGGIIQEQVAGNQIDRALDVRSIDGRHGHAFLQPTYAGNYLNIDIGGRLTSQAGKYEGRKGGRVTASKGIEALTLADTRVTDSGEESSGFLDHKHRKWSYESTKFTMPEFRSAEGGMVLDTAEGRVDLKGAAFHTAGPSLIHGRDGVDLGAAVAMNRYYDNKESGWGLSTDRKKGYYEVAQTSEIIGRDKVVIASDRGDITGKAPTIILEKGGAFYTPQGTTRFSLLELRRHEEIRSRRFTFDTGAALPSVAERIASAARGQDGATGIASDLIAAAGSAFNTISNLASGYNQGALVQAIGSEMGATRGTIGLHTSKSISDAMDTQHGIVFSGGQLDITTARDRLADLSGMDVDIERLRLDGGGLRLAGSKEQLHHRSSYESYAASMDALNPTSLTGSYSRGKYKEDASTVHSASARIGHLEAIQEETEVEVHNAQAVIEEISGEPIKKTVTGDQDVRRVKSENIAASATVNVLSGAITGASASYGKGDITHRTTSNTSSLTIGGGSEAEVIAAERKEDRVKGRAVNVSTSIPLTENGTAFSNPIGVSYQDGDKRVRIEPTIVSPGAVSAGVHEIKEAGRSVGEALAPVRKPVAENSVVADPTGQIAGKPKPEYRDEEIDPLMPDYAEQKYDTALITDAVSDGLDWLGTRLEETRGARRVIALSDEIDPLIPDYAEQKHNAALITDAVSGGIDWLGARLEETRDARRAIALSDEIDPLMPDYVEMRGNTSIIVDGIAKSVDWMGRRLEETAVERAKIDEYGGDTDFLSPAHNELVDFLYRPRKWLETLKGSHAKVTQELETLAAYDQHYFDSLRTNGKGWMFGLELMLGDGEISSQIIYTADHARNIQDRLPINYAGVGREIVRHIALETIYRKLEDKGVSTPSTIAENINFDSVD